MARTLEQLKKRYSYNPSLYSKRKTVQLKGGGRNRGKSKEKPKDVKKVIKRIFSYIKKYKLSLFISFTLMLLNAFSSLIGSYMLAPLIDRITKEVVPEVTLKISIIERYADKFIYDLIGFINMENTVFSYITVVCIILGTVFITGILTAYLQGRVMLYISQNAIENIRNDLFCKLQKLPVSFFDKNQTGEIMSRFTNDIDNIDNMLSNSLMQILSGIISITGTFLFMITTNVLLTFITVLFIPLFIKIVSSIAKRSSKYYKGQQMALGTLNGYIEEMITGEKVIKIFNREEDCIKEFETLNNDMREKQIKAQFFGGIMGPVMGNTSQMSFSFTVGIGAILMCMGKLTPGAITVFANYSRQFSQPINMISQQTNTVFSALSGAERVFAVMDENEEVIKGRKDIKIKGNVEFKNVTFSYIGDKPVISNINLKVNENEKIAFVGSTGAGKTTVTNLLNRFYEVNEGHILIEGVDIKDISKDYLRKNISMVLQDTHLFTGTVMENIRYGRLDASDDDVITAAKSASAHSFIMKLENGYDTIIDGDGKNLSKGQGQLLNIARAALSKSPILVLDEATSSVDTITEKHIEEGMERLMHNRTTFVIAHRLSTVRNADKIIVLEHGRIIETGTHRELIEKKGRYYMLYTGKKELD